VDEGKAVVSIVIPEGFGKAMSNAASTPPQIQVILDGTDPSAADAAQFPVENMPRPLSPGLQPGADQTLAACCARRHAQGCGLRNSMATDVGPGGAGIGDHNDDSAGPAQAPIGTLASCNTHFNSRITALSGY